MPDGVEAEVGDRALVPFAGHSYLSVVSAVGVTPDEGIRNVLQIYGIQDYKDRILPSEIDFWRTLARYYMCSVGEVYKVAYPSAKNETVRPSRRKEKPERCVNAAAAGMPPCVAEAAGRIMTALSPSRPVLMSSPESWDVMLEICRRHAEEGRNVIWLVPEIKLGKAMAERAEEVLGSCLVVWGANITAARKREAARFIRSGRPYVVLGTRSSLFLPYASADLVIVQEEHDMSYKQTSPAPRYNGRDAAVLLASKLGAAVLLESATPSFESLLNAFTGKYLRVETADAAAGPDWDIIDTRAELFKNGMRGELSVRLLNAVPLYRDKDAAAFYKPRRAAFPKTEKLLPELQSALGTDVFLTDDIIAKPLPQGCVVLGIFGADAMLSRQDFRADERFIQTVMQAVAQCGGSLRRVVIQTREASHPVFSSLVSGNVTALLSERKEFGYPPFTRIVDICFRDSSAGRQAKMTEALCLTLMSAGFTGFMPVPDMGVRLILPKDRNLTARKEALQRLVADFEKAHKYAGHIFFDVDP